MDIIREIELAEERIRLFILRTPLIESKELSKLIEGKVYLKLESEQYTGSFKARGSMNKLLSLTDEEKERGTITAGYTHTHTHTLQLWGLILQKNRS
ncbi:MAG: pyridoxal-phosphate dependent enzyme [Flavobacteriales bacterium]|nr:pyridoxal-phosphate dependent enzyme [Flavobacteriales bacterium]